MNTLVRSLDAQISLMVAKSTRISKNMVHDRLFSNDEGSLVVAPAARMYWDDLRKIKLSPEFEDLELFEQELVKAWLRAFNFSDGQFTKGYTLMNDEEWSYIEHWYCKQCGVFEIEVAFDDFDDPICPACGGDMEYVPQTVEEFATRDDSMDLELPYDSVEDNETFWNAQRGGYGRDAYGDNPDMWDNFDVRDPNDEGAWAEYMEPAGMGEFYGSVEWRELHLATKDFIAEADRLVAKWEANARTGRQFANPLVSLIGLPPAEKWDYVTKGLRPYVEEAWNRAVKLYEGGHINTVAMGLIVHRLVSGTRFDRYEMVKLTQALPAKSHVDGTPLGHSLFEWMQDFQGDLDDILEDGADFDDATRHPDEEQRVVNIWATHFEREIEEWWKYQAKLRQPVLDENGVKIWASAWTGIGDVAFNIAFLHAMAAELPKAEANKVAHNAKKSARWSPNDTWVVGATKDGLVLNNRAVVGWAQAERSMRTLAFPIPQRERVLNAMRNAWKAAQPEFKDSIVAVGQSVKVL